METNIKIWIIEYPYHTIRLSILFGTQTGKQQNQSYNYLT